MQKKLVAANKLFKKGDNEAAIQAYTSILEGDNDEEDGKLSALLNRSSCYHLTGKYRNALDDANQAKSMNTHRIHVIRGYL